MSLKKAFLSLGVLSALVLSSCTIGLGEEVDLEAPVITITSPENLAKVGLNFELRGTCTDNIKVKKVEVRNLNLGDNGLLGEATIEGEEWYFPISLTHEQEGEISFSCSAIDEAGNTSTKSIKTKVLLVDQTSPEDLSWYIDRGNGIQTPLYTLEKLKSIYESENALNTDNKDIAQNQVFNIYSRFYDAMSINEITLNLEKEDGTVLISKTVSSDETNINYIGDSSIFTPKFTFTEEELVQKDPSFISGKHYLRLSYSCKDDHGNANSKALDWMIWYPESDYPGISQSFIENNSILINVGTAIPINFFDDDGIQEYKCALLETATITNAITFTSTSQLQSDLINNENIRNTIFEVTVNANETSLANSNLSGARDSFMTITAPSTPCELYLLACAKDVNGKWKSLVVPCSVTDAKAPLLYVEQPNENEVPTLTNNVFTISGYTFDSNGCSTVKIAYIPESADNIAAETRAKTILQGDGTNLGAGEKLWTYNLGAATIDQATGWKKQTYSFDFNLFDTETFAESKRKEEKFFELMVTDTDGNKVFRQFKVAGDSLPPTLKIVFPESDMQNYDPTGETEGFNIKFKATKATGIGIDTSKYVIRVKDGTADENNNRGTLTLEDDYYTFSILNETLRGYYSSEKTQLLIEFEAEDNLGNKVTDKRTVILSTLPFIESITSDMNTSTTYKKDDSIKIKAIFNKPVKVTGTPRIKLSNITGISTDAYANYSTGSDTNTLIFEYKVQNNATTSQIKTAEDINVIDLNGGKIEVDSTAGSGNASIKLTDLNKNDFNKTSDPKRIKLDAVAPTISSITLAGPMAGPNPKTYVKKGDVVTAEVTMTKDVNISGNPVLQLKVGSTNLNFTFQSVNGKNIKFEYTVAGNLNGTINADKSTAIASANLSSIKDLPGNSMVAGASGSNSTGITIDNNPPAVPVIKNDANGNNLAEGKYNGSVKFAITGENNATIKYSTDGGISWNTYSSVVTLSDNGTYSVTARQTDRAGNVSDNSTPISVEINNTFPVITGLTIKKPDGHYKKGTEIEVKMNFDGYVNADVGQVYLKFTDKDGNNETTIPVTAATNVNALSFIYTVADGKHFDGMLISAVVFNGLKDVNGNSTTTQSQTEVNGFMTSNCQRTGIILDGIVPIISTYNPENTKISSESDNNKFKITLTFSEPVAKETGTIILQRTSGWAIPAVMTSDEFLKYYNQMTSANKEKVMRTQNGKELYHGRTGIAVGPYQKITHGLKVSNGKYVPDEATKYVLAYDLGLYDGSASLNDGTQTGTFTASVSDIRSALESVGYHQHKIDVASDNVKIYENATSTTAVGNGQTGTRVEITFSEAIEDGREWNLIIPDTAFRDDAENAFAGLSGTTYTVWSNNVAQPVVRVDRYSHGWGAREPNASGELSTITADSGKYSTTCAQNSAARKAPTGYARARIDCETPGVTINYKTYNSGTAAYNANTATTVSDTEGYYTNYRSNIADVATTTMESGITTAYTANNHIIVGDGTYTSARKDYISCIATKTNFTQSKLGVEGIFRTVVYVHTENKRNIEGQNYYFSINIEGGTAPGGQPNVDGFPLRDATDQNDRTGAGRYSKNAYNLGGGNKNNQNIGAGSGTPGQNFVWVSYEIISTDWAILVCRSNHSRSYPLNSYGNVAYLSSIVDWDGTN